MRTLRTPDERFANLPGWPFAPHYVEIPDGDGGTLRVHYVDEGPADARRRCCCCTASRRGAYLYRKMIPVLTAAGHRVRRARPHRVRALRQARRARRLHLPASRRLDARRASRPLDLRDVTLVCQDWGGLIGLRLVAENPDRFARVVAANTFLPTGDAPAGEAFLAWQGVLAERRPTSTSAASSGAAADASCPPEVIAAYDAPFPDDSYKAGARQFPMLVPIVARRSGRGAEPRGVGGARRVGEAVRSPRSATRTRSRAAATAPSSARARREGSAPHHHRGRRPLPAGGQGRGAGQGHRGLVRPNLMRQP